MNTWTIAVFEFKRYFKWKQEIISLVIMALGFGFSALWPVLKATFDKDYQVAVIGSELSPKVAGFQFSVISPETRQTVIDGLGEHWHALLEVKQDKIQVTFKEKASWQSKLQAALKEWHQQRQIAQLPLSDEQRKMITSLPDITTVLLVEDKANKDEKARELLSAGLLILLMLGVFSGFGLLFAGITSEKQNRVTEQLLTLITPAQWMQGKILGVSLFCLKTMLTYGILFALFVQGAAVMADKPGFQLPISGFEILTMVLFILLGVLLVNSFIAAFAATIDDPNHSSRSIIMFLPALPVGLAMGVTDNAEGAMMQFLSIFPLSSFAGMPLRLAHTTVPMWQIALSLALLVACLWWFKSAATRVFTLGIRMYGKEPSWKQMLESFLFPVKHS